MTTSQRSHEAARDVPVSSAVARGAAVAFFPLLLWGLVGPLLASVFPSRAAGAFVLLVGVAGCYVLAGFRAGMVTSADVAGRAAAAAGLLTYLLVLPVNLFTGQPIGIIDIATSAVLAAGIGWAAGQLARRARRHVA